ncbi:iron-containing redox enzyme family protein [Streptomyces catenulae]|uniref:Iron-containing redox enzyme family protein n=1 Tax=Streptomyces catenulae TaxID=66875 RepID=A0ABV2YZG7_9ACTN|nr:iron-containing redox enzyme family protein [Streptomyces catenulae]
MGPLTGLYRELGALEPAPDALRSAERLLDGVSEKAPFPVGALDDLERELHDAAPEFGDLDADGVRVVAATAARHLALLADRDGVWLAPFARVPLCHLPTGARLAELSHAYRFGPGRQGRLSGMTGGLLRALGKPSGDPGSGAYLESLRLTETAYLLPTLLLALAQAPGSCTPELLAAVEPTLTGTWYDVPEWIAACVTTVAEETEGVEVGWPPAQRPDEVAPAVGAALREFAASGLATDGEERFARFARLLGDTARLFRAELTRACLNALRAPEHAVRDLVARKTPSARHAHGTATVDGTLLDHYFDRSPEAGGDLLRALADSKWIKPGEPDRSPFLTVLTPRHAPMGKIFSAEDLALVRRWITGLTGPGDGPVIAPLAVTVPVTGPGGCPDAPVPVTFDGPRTRELFHDLVAGRDRAGAVRRAAAFVEHWLDAAERMEKPAFTWELPERYDAEEFPAWMQATYEAMASAPVAPVTDDGKAHHDRSFHGAADNLVDGAWLQGLTRSTVMSDSERLLYDIYWDEIGNGKPGQSHGVLYEDLLVGLGHRLPKFWTREFVEDVDFLDEGFYAPVFRLAVAEFPRSRFPEIVGVNMVCEFHGLGSAGISKADDLTELGYDTSFTRLHIADDNVEMGHSAKSRDAVVFLMAQAARLGVADLVWERIRRGATAMRMAYVVLMQGRLKIAPTQVPNRAPDRTPHAHSR